MQNVVPCQIEYTSGSGGIVDDLFKVVPGGYAIDVLVCGGMCLSIDTLGEIAVDKSKPRTGTLAHGRA